MECGNGRVVIFTTEKLFCLLKGLDEGHRKHDKISKFFHSSGGIW